MRGLLPVPQPPPVPVCKRRHMSRCRLCRPAVALGATTTYRETSSGWGASRGEVQGCVCVCVCVACGRCHQARRERGKPRVRGTVGAPAPQSCLVVQNL